MEKCYVYSNETNEQVAAFEGESYEDALQLAFDSYDTNDFHMSAVDLPFSNA